MEHQRLIQIHLNFELSPKNKRRAQMYLRAKDLQMTLGEYITKDIDIPESFSEFANLILDMKYDEAPNYSKLSNL
jgi:hypothetical protein